MSRNCSRPIVTNPDLCVSARWKAGGKIDVRPGVTRVMKRGPTFRKLAHCDAAANLRREEEALIIAIETGGLRSSTHETICRKGQSAVYEKNGQASKRLTKGDTRRHALTRQLTWHFQNGRRVFSRPPIC
jgi:hypothetical protein